MKFDLASDLHLEIGGIVELAHKAGSWEPGAHTCVLAGDVVSIDFLKGKSAKNEFAREFFKIISEKYKKVIWVFGNHEHYDGDMTYTRRNAADIIKNLGVNNIDILDKETIEIEDAVLWCATMWTDFERRSPVVMANAHGLMNDYRKITIMDAYFDVRDLRPEDVLVLHDISMNSLLKFIELKTDKKKVMVTHHAPSYMSVQSGYKGDRLNGCYATEMFDLIYDSDIKLAVHGHMHEPTDYMIGECRVASNPRGYYGYETRAYTWKPVTIEV